jgi:hypothetical protein
MFETDDGAFIYVSYCGYVTNHQQLCPGMQRPNNSGRRVLFPHLALLRDGGAAVHLADQNGLDWLRTAHSRRGALSDIRREIASLKRPINARGHFFTACPIRCPI